MADSSTGSRQEAALIALAWREGDSAAFGQLVRRHQGAVRAQLRRLTAGDAAWADDLAQETFLQAWRKLGQFRADARFATWLYRIAYTAFLQANRARREPRSPPLTDAHAGVDPTGSIDRRHDLDRALEQLPQAQRSALVLCYDFDLSHSEAACVLGVPEGTVKAHVARGKAKLRELLAVPTGQADGCGPGEECHE
jgi:RNA polymerase sigma factor (sigma-70 family)